MSSGTVAEIGIVLCATVLAATPARGQEPLPAPEGANAFVEVKQKLMYLKTGSFEPGGLGVYRDGARFDIGFFGSNVEALFEESAAGLAIAQSFRTLRIAGMSFTLAGIFALAIDATWWTFAVALPVASSTAPADALFAALPAY